MSLGKLKSGRKIRLKHPWKSIYGKIAPQKKYPRNTCEFKAAEKNLEVNKEKLLDTKEVEDYKKSVISLKNEGGNENTLS